MGWLGAFVAMLIGGGAGYVGMASSSVRAVGVLGKGWGAGIAAAPLGGLIGGLLGLSVYCALRPEMEAIRARISTESSTRMLSAKRELEYVQRRHEIIRKFMEERGL